eukprot:3044157-Pyramimonas_sp.AAC.1
MVLLEHGCGKLHRFAMPKNRIETERRDLLGSFTNLTDVSVHESSRWQQKWASKTFSVQRLLQLLQQAHRRAKDQHWPGLQPEQVATAAKQTDSMQAAGAQDGSALKYLPPAGIARLTAPLNKRGRQGGWTWQIQTAILALLRKGADSDRSAGLPKFDTFVEFGQAD